MNWLDLVVLVIETAGGAPGELDSLQEVVGNMEPLAGICSDYMGTYDFLREFIVSDKIAVLVWKYVYIC